MNINKKRYIISLSVIVIGLIALISGTSYAILSGTSQSTHEQIIRAGSVELRLTENYENIDKGMYALPDEDGLLQEEFYEFTISNIGSTSAKYDLKLLNNEEEANKLSDEYIKVELEGASGGPGHTDGNNTNNYGYGAKTNGYVYLEQGTKLYFYVGGKGGAPTTKTCTNTTATEATGTGGTGGYNGGGAGGNDSCQSTNAANDAAGGGGGATDVRLEGGSWDNTASLTSRIMVAGGGGGGTYTGNAIQGSGGGALYGDQEKRPSNRTTYLSTMPSQTSGYAFGKGGPGMYCTDNTGSGGHGGGYYGAKTGTSCDYRAGGIGGSSYISGYAGANSVSAAGTVSHNLTTKHYSNIYFIGADIIPDQNDGNGHASIRFVGEKPQRKNTNLNNVRYIKDCTNYNSINAANHWIEIQATKDGVNIAKGKTVTGSAAQHATNVYSRITDGDITYSIYANPATQANNQCVTVDLGQTYDLDEVAVWNYFGDQRKYRENTVTVSSDNSTWTDLRNNEVWQETSNGARWNAYIDHINGYRGRTYLTLWYDGYANNGGTKSTATTQTTWKNLIYGTDTTFNGTVMNGTAAGATWGPNYLTLDGSNDWVKIAAMNYARPTIEVVFSPSVTTSSQTYVIGNIEGGGYGIAYQDTNKIWSHFYINSAYRSLQFPTLATPGEIYQAAVSYNQTLYNQYYKGNLVNSISDFAGSIGTTQSSTIMTLGTNPSGSNASAPYFPGKIYSVRVYNGALTDEQIHHNYLYDKQLFHLD